MRVSDLRQGQRVRIRAVSPGEVAYRQKLIAMGLVPGTELTVTRIAPFGDPIEILVRGSRLSLRKNEASILLVEEA